jgi:ParB/RepB/Spo0J family partition protein
MKTKKSKPAKAGKRKVTATTGQVVAPIPINHIKPSPTNPRKVFDEGGLKELAASIAIHGIMQPILVRPLNGTGKFELVAGERRWRAAKVAKLEFIPGIVRELDDAQAMELQQIENLQRVDLTILEEADGFAALIATGNYTPESLGEKLGKSRATIYERLKLAKLSEPVRKAVENGKLPASQAALIASVPGEAAQAEVLKAALEDFNYGEDVMSVRDLKQLIEADYTRNLNKATFDTKAVYGQTNGSLNVDVAACGSCKDCPKRSGNMPGANLGSPNICTDVACYKAKAEQATKEILADHAAKGFPVLNEMQAKQTFSYGSLQGRAPYYDANERVWLVDDDDYDKTWKETLKKALPTITLGVDERGELHELIDKESAIEALKATKLKLHKASVSSELTQPTTADCGSDRGAAIEEGKIRRLQRERKGEAVFATVRGFTMLQLLGLVCSEMVSDYKFKAALVKALAISPDADVDPSPEQIATQLGLMNEPNMAETLVRCFLTNKGQLEGYKVDQFAEVLGLDMENIELEAAKEFKAAKAEKATKVKGSKKK